MLELISYSLLLSSIIIYVYFKQEENAKLNPHLGSSFDEYWTQEEMMPDYEPHTHTDRTLTYDEFWYGEVGADIPSSEGVEWNEAEDLFDECENDCPFCGEDECTETCPKFNEYEDWYDSYIDEEELAENKMLSIEDVQEAYYHLKSIPSIPHTTELEQDWYERVCDQRAAQEQTELDPDNAYARAMRMTIRQLKAIASALGIKGYGTMVKSVLAASIIQAGYNFN